MPHVQRLALVRVARAVPEVESLLVERFGAQREPDGTFTTSVRNDPTTAGVLTMRAQPAAAATGDDTPATEVEIEAETELGLPFFGGVVEALVALHYERVVDWTAKVIEADVEGHEEPELPKAVPLLPAVPFTREQATLLLTAGFAIAIATFGSSIIGQFSSDIAHSFRSSDDTLGVSLAILRIGALVALFASALADRIGRRRVVLVALVGVAAANLVSALSPNLAIFTAAQTVTRGASAAAVIAAGIAAIEEAPEGGRAYATSILALTGGVGFTLTVLLFPLGDRFTWAWRLVFLLSAAAVICNRAIARKLVESSRYERTAASNIERGRLREVFGRQYASRFWLLAAATFLTNLLTAPSAQLTNKYLTDVHHFSHLGIVVLRAVTTAVPGFIGLILAGRLAERYGRRPVAATALAIGAVVRAVFYLGSGPVLWIASAIGDLTLSCGFIAIGVLNTELFPTETRGTSNGFIGLIGVLGSVAGLLMAGALSDPLGGLGRSIALTTIGTLVAALLVVPFLPESAHRNLDEISPSLPDDL